jgi:hypothetical protein
LGLDGEQACEQLIKLRGQLRALSARRGAFGFCVKRKQLLNITRLKGRTSTERVKEGTTERVEVGAVVYTLGVEHLLWGDVVRRTHRHPHTGLVWGARSVSALLCRCHRAERWLRGACEFDEAEVSELGDPISVDQNVGGFKVAVYHPKALCVVERFAQVEDITERLIYGERPTSLNTLLKRLPLYKLHHNKVKPALFTRVIHAHHVGVCELSGGLCLKRKAGARSLTCRVWREALKRYVEIKSEVAGLEHNPHTTRA